MTELTHKEMSSRGGKSFFGKHGMLGIKKNTLASLEARFKANQITPESYTARKEKLTKEIELLTSGSPE